MTLFFWLAAAASLLTAGVHTFAGGVAVARPLLASSALPAASKWLNYYCWHITTVLLVCMAIGFALSAWRPEFAANALLLTPLCFVLSLLSVWVAMKGTIPPLRLPSTSLFAVTGLLGLAGVLT